MSSESDFVQDLKLPMILDRQKRLVVTCDVLKNCSMHVHRYWLGYGDSVCSARISIILRLAAKGTASFGLYLFQRTFNCGSVCMNVLQVPKQVAGPNIHCKNKLQDMHMLIKCCPLI